MEGDGEEKEGEGRGRECSGEMSGGGEGERRDVGTGPPIAKGRP